MTRDDIIRMAREADIDPHDMCEDHRIAENNLERFAALVAAAEREVILKMLEAEWFKSQADVEQAIRARGETK